MATSPLGRKLRSAREARGWSRETLAKASGTSTANISRIELYGHVPSLSSVYAWALALELEPSDLLPTGDELAEAAS